MIWIRLIFRTPAEQPISKVWMDPVPEMTLSLWRGRREIRQSERQNSALCSVTDYCLTLGRHASGLPMMSGLQGATH